MIQREDGGLLAVEEVPLPPPTVNGLANLLAHAMLRPLNDGNRRRPGTIYLRDRPQWEELLPHLRQLGIEVLLAEDLPRLDEAAIKWMQKAKRPPSAARSSRSSEAIPREETHLVHGCNGPHGMVDAMFKGAYPSRNPYPPMTRRPSSRSAWRLTSWKRS